MLTDTYPDQKNHRHLMLYDSRDYKIYHLGQFYSYPKGMREKDIKWDESRMRCDLHPKWGAMEDYIYFDSVHEGFRGLYRIKVADLINGKK